MTRAAIYSRFSSDLQRDRSIEDQVALCRTYAQRNGLDIVAEFDDRARSGASIFGRTGLGSLMEAARDGSFEVVVVEALDRLSRDQEDLAGIYKRLKFLDIEIRAVHDGVADQVQVGIRGLVGALYLQDLGHKVRRGMAGVVRDGRHAGGLAYGYRPVPGKPGELVIEATEAEIVREIFARYIAGETPRQIAGDLNRRSIPPPRARYWAAVTINGNKKRGNGILLNPLYSGVIIWNRVRMVKNPDTGRRVSRVNAKADWHRAEAPHLRIVDQGAFDAAQAVKAGRSLSSGVYAKRPRRMLSGLLRCGACGSGMSIKDKRSGRVRIVCTHAVESGTCSNLRPYHVDAIERAVVEGLRENLGSREAIALYVKTYNEERRRLASQAINERELVAKRLAAVERERERALTAYQKGFMTEDEAEARLPGLRSDAERLRVELAAVGKEPTVVELHPTTVRQYLAAIESLDLALQRDRDGGSEESTRALRSLVETVTVHPPGEDRQVLVEVQGQLASLIGGEAFPTMRIARGGSMVAEAGIEPATFGL